MTLLLEPRTGIIPKLSIGDRLRVARKQTGLESGPFADAIGLSRVTVSKYENDRVQPHSNNLRVWAEATGVDLEWLETGNEKAPALVGEGRSYTPRDSNPEPADYGSDLCSALVFETSITLPETADELLELWALDLTLDRLHGEYQP